MLLNMVLPEAHFKTIKAPQENKKKWPDWVDNA